MIDPSRLARSVRARSDALRRKPGERPWPENFRDRLTGSVPSSADMIKLARSGRYRGTRADADRIPVLRSGLPQISRDQVSITWVGHATFVIQIGGLTVLTDPIWSETIPGVPRRLTPPGVGWRDLPNVDAVLISHNHYDHLDAPTIRRLPRDTAIFAPAALGRWFTRRGFVDVTELDWWESTSLVGVQFDFVPSHHWSRRGVGDTCRSLWGGWMLTTESGERIYFAGDTGYGPGFAEIAERYPDINVALLPIGAYEPKWFHGGTHMDPEEAVQAYQDLKAAHLATMHWGTFLLSKEPVLEPMERVRAAWDAGQYPAEDLWALAIGESRVL